MHWMDLAIFLTCLAVGTLLAVYAPSRMPKRPYRATRTLGRGRG